MARVSHFWPLAMATALTVVIAGLTLPQDEVTAADPSDSVAPALASRPAEVAEPQAPEGTFLEPAPKA